VTFRCSRVLQRNIENEKRKEVLMLEAEDILVIKEDNILLSNTY
jgi:hypothetical protein